MDALDQHTPPASAGAQASAKLAVFTVCTNNYMPLARNLFASVLRHYPNAELFLCLADEWITPDMAAIAPIYPEAVQIVTLDQLDISDLTDFTFRYDVMELTTAAKPFMFNYLFERHMFDQILYLDTDIEIFAPLTTVFEALDGGASMVLTPHICEPAEFGDAVKDIIFMRAGVYNLGFLAVSRCEESLDMMQWWSRRLRYDCLNDQSIGIFVDQKFMDLVPGFAPKAFICRDVTLNAAYWNMTQRRIGRSQDGWTVDDRPLKFFHFSGIEPTNTTRLSRHGTLEPAAGSPLRTLLDDYAARLIADGYQKEHALPNAFANFASNVPIPRAVRQMYRSRHQLWIDNPFHTFEEVLHLPDPDATFTAFPYIVTNFMRFLYDELGACRTELDLGSAEAVVELVNWYICNAGAMYGLDWRLVAPVEQRIRQPIDVTVIGYLSSATGVGQAARATYANLAMAHILCDKLDLTVPELQPALGQVQIFHVNADGLPLVADMVRAYLPKAGYRIAVPFWELETLPAAWHGAFACIDEVWASSRFIQKALEKCLTKPVVYMPLAFAPIAPVAGGRAAFELPPDDFLFFFAFDFHSYLERKNPLAAVAAFKKAFPIEDDETVGLVIKTQSSFSNPAGLAILNDAICDDPRIRLIDATLEREQVISLITACDCLLSLHRSEGFGLLVAEAMLLERPVIATDYGATAELVTPETGFPVAYELVAVAEDAYPFGLGQIWAEPDIAHAARLMRDIRSSPLAYAAQVKAARLHLLSEYGAEKIRKRQVNRLREIGLKLPHADF